MAASKLIGLYPEFLVQTVQREEPCSKCSYAESGSFNCGTSTFGSRHLENLPRLMARSLSPSTLAGALRHPPTKRLSGRLSMVPRKTIWRSVPPMASLRFSVQTRAVSVAGRPVSEWPLEPYARNRAQPRRQPTTSLCSVPNALELAGTSALVAAAARARVQSNGRGNTRARVDVCSYFAGVQVWCVCAFERVVVSTPRRRQTSEYPPRASNEQRTFSRR